MPAHFFGLLREHESPGLILISQRLPVGVAVEAILRTWANSPAEELANRISYLK